jgi:hypothetical protein
MKVFKATIFIAMKIKQKSKLISSGFISASARISRATWCKQMAQSAINAHPVVFREKRIRIGLAVVMLSALTSGCVGFVGGGYGGGGGVVVAPAPDVVLFGGGYDRGRDVHGYSQRGTESRAAAHGGGDGGRR